MSIPGAASPLFLATTGAADAFEISRSLRFNSADSASLNRTPSAASNRTTWTWSGWLKTGSGLQAIFGSTAASNFFGSDDQTVIYLYQDKLNIYDYQSGNVINKVTERLFRDPSAWFHLVISIETGASTAEDRVKLYVNGQRETAFGINVNPSQNATTILNSTAAQYIACPNDFFNGYLADVHFIDGQALAPTNFGETDDNGVWRPKKYSGSYGTNGFHLPFTDNSSNAALGTDTSGNSNTWTVNNLIAASTTLYGVSFDGSGDKLTVTDDASLAFGTGEFTVEMYFIADTVSGNDVLYDSRASTGSPSDGFSIVRNGNELKTYTSGAYQVTSSVTLSTGQRYHLAVTREGTTQKMYLDGTQVGSATVSNNFSQQKATIGSDVNGSENWDGFISNVRLVKGTAVYTANFTAPTANLTNITNTVLLCCQSTTSTTAATVAPGTITASGDVAVISHSSPPAADIDSLVDTPTNGTQTDTGVGNEVVGNYATLNPLAKGADCTLSNGNLDFAYGTSTTRGACMATFGMSSGKWYWEITLTASSVSEYSPTLFSGITNTTSVSSVGDYVGKTASGWGYYSSSGAIRNNQSDLLTVSTYGVGDVIGYAFDADNGKFYVSKNGTWQNSGNPAAGSGAVVSSLPAGTYFPAVSDGGGTETFSASANYGQRAFAYAAPSGYKSLNTASLPTPTIADGSQYFDTKLYTGTGSDKTISGYNFSPDFAWLKCRSNTSNHALYDTVRGAGKQLESQATTAEVNYPNSLKAFTSDGFTVGTDGINNTNNRTYVGWAWDGGTSTVTNNDGSTASQVRVNPTAGFSIASWDSDGSSTTVGTGLSSVDFIIQKCTSHATNWSVWSSAFASNTGYLSLDTTNALTVNSTVFSGAPTGGVVPLGSNGNYGTKAIMYAWSEVAGFSKFGSYEGNGSAEGPFIHTGFKVAWLLIKNIDNYGSGYDWFIFDSKRDTYNTSDAILKANLADSESDSDSIDMLSNGFKLRATTNGINLNAHTHVYFAFASNPFASNGGLAR